jgi:hypothetical protein
VHLVGFIIRIYHDARSSECQVSMMDVLSAVAEVDLENGFRHFCYNRSRKMKTVCIKLNFQYLEWTWKVLVNYSAYSHYISIMY